jgi:hypothetical protein
MSTGDWIASPLVLPVFCIRCLSHYHVFTFVVGLSKFANYLSRLSEDLEERPAKRRSRASVHTH